MNHVNEMFLLHFAKLQISTHNFHIVCGGRQSKSLCFSALLLKATLFLVKRKHPFLVCQKLPARKEFEILVTLNMRLTRTGSIGPIERMFRGEGSQLDQRIQKSTWWFWAVPPAFMLWCKDLKSSWSLPYSSRRAQWLWNERLSWETGQGIIREETIYIEIASFLFPKL